MSRIRAVCAACGHAESWNAAAALNRLRGLQMLLREKNPTWDVLRALAEASATRLACVRCGAAGLRIDDAGAEGDNGEDGGDFGPTRLCATCRQPIPPERIEALPGAKTCLACQNRQDQSGGDEHTDYCPRCGASRVPRLRRAGVARYVASCPECGFEGS